MNPSELQYQVSISQSRCLSFQGYASRDCQRRCNVSISQSRCLSFQDLLSTNVDDWKISFNLAIEMLVISGSSHETDALAVAVFQSRNRDACHFRGRAGFP